MVQVAKICCICFLASLALRGVATAQDAGDCDAGDDAGMCEGGGEDAGFDGGAPADGGVPLACDGGLCDTTNGSSCGSAGRPVGFSLIAITLALVGLALSRRHISHRSTGKDVANLLLYLAFALPAGMSGAARAEPPPAVDVVIHEPPPPRRILAVEYNPLPLLLGKISANIVLAPLDHHALVLSGSYVSVETAPIYVFDEAGNSTQLPKQKFKGFGGELGYRYYLDERGPRGFFIGPSIMAAWLTATAQDGSRTPFVNYGLAGDIGYQALLWDSVTLSLGGGVQYTRTNQPIPNQQFPAKVSANGGVRPRLLLSVGWAF